MPSGFCPARRALQVCDRQALDRRTTLGADLPTKLASGAESGRRTASGIRCCWSSPKARRHFQLGARLTVVPAISQQTVKPIAVVQAECLGHPLSEFLRKTNNISHCRSNGPQGSASPLFFQTQAIVSLLGTALSCCLLNSWRSWFSVRFRARDPNANPGFGRYKKVTQCLDVCTAA